MITKQAEPDVIEQTLHTVFSRIYEAHLIDVKQIPDAAVRRVVQLTGLREHEDVLLHRVEHELNCIDAAMFADIIIAYLKEMPDE